MPNWKEVLEEVAKVATEGRNTLHAVRRKYLTEIHNYTAWNVIAYCSGWP